MVVNGQEGGMAVLGYIAVAIPSTKSKNRFKP